MKSRSASNPARASICAPPPTDPIRAPERRFEKSQCAADRETLNAHTAELQSRRDELAKTERSLAAEAQQVGGKATEHEATLYSGSVTAPKELEALQEEIRLLSSRKSEIEDQELELLEQIEGVDAEIASDRERAGTLEARIGELEAAIGAAEQEARRQIEALEAERRGCEPAVATGLLAEYERLRSKANLRGVAAAAFRSGQCDGCNTALPVKEATRIRAEPSDAIVRCVHCGRLLVR